MSGSRYWNPDTECLPRPALEQWQLHKFRELLSWAGRNPVWKMRLDQAGVRAADIRSLEDIRRVPFLTRDHIRDDQAAHPPFGAMLTIRPDQAMTRHQTSGTSGTGPLVFLQTRRDWHWGAYAWAQALYGFGLRSTDIVFFPFGYGPFIGFWGAHYACQLIGATTVAGGNLSTEQRIRQALECNATAMVATPSYLLRILEVSRAMGVDWKAAALARLMVAGEPGGNVDATRDLIENAFDARLGDFLGMTETAGIAGFSCDTARGAIHIAENYFLEEVVHPQSGEPVAMGEVGERVTTAFGLGSYPIIRYRTGDLVRRIPADACACGRGFDLYDGGVIGRADDMLVVRGTNVHPTGVEQVIRGFPEIREFRIVVTKAGWLDRIRVDWEPFEPKPEDDVERLSSSVARKLAERHEGLRFEVAAHPPGTLPIFELKARRVQDLRKEGATE